MNNQAFAWNPSIRGGKVEDTVILREAEIENLTATPELPMLTEAIVEGAYRGGRAGVAGKGRVHPVAGLAR